MAQPPSRNVPAALHKRILELRSFPYDMIGFSDTVVVSVSFAGADATMAGYRLFVFLCSISTMMLNCLALGIPLRAGIDVGLGVRGLFPQEVYGPVLSEAYQLESTVAKWPRVAIGQSLVDYLDHLDAHSGDALAEHVLNDCRNLVRRDLRDDVQMLHILSNTIIDRLGTIPDLSYGWVSQQRAKFASLGNDKLRGYYERLADYFREHGYNDARTQIAVDGLSDSQTPANSAERVDGVA